MSLAILCTGQGAQGATMFDLTANAPAAQPIFAKAAAHLGGKDPRQLVKTASETELTANRIAQTVCVTQALVAVSVLQEALAGRSIIAAGYSAGDLAAWGASGIFSHDLTLDLVDQRVKIMNDASQPGDCMASVRGISRSDLAELCASQEAYIAIVNPDESYLIGARAEPLAKTIKLLDDKQIHVRRIRVQIASHTPLLKQASTGFHHVLQKAGPINPLKPNIRLISDIDGQFVTDFASGSSKLSAQISQTVEWAACMKTCIDAGVTAFLELGPGNNLSHMIGRAYPEIPTRSFEDFPSIEEVISWVKSCS